MSTPTYEDVVAALNEASGEAEVREAFFMLRRVEDPKLDALRVEVRTALTSDLIGLVAHPETIVRRFEDDSVHDDTMKLIIGGAMLVVADELDRRIPVPVPQ